MIRKRLLGISDGINDALEARKLTRAQREAGLEIYGERAGGSFKRKCRNVQAFLLDNRSPSLVRESMAESEWLNPTVKKGTFLSLLDCVIDENVSAILSGSVRGDSRKLQQGRLGSSSPHGCTIF